MNVFRKADILIPKNVDLEKWSVVACDQYTAQPEYWEDAAKFVGESPSTLNIVYPEAFLSEGDARIAKINIAILRIAFYEILYNDKIPANAAVNEAVLLAQNYTYKEDVSFINGILGSYTRSLEGENV